MNLDVFATRLKTLRSSSHLTLQQVGDAVKYSLKTIGNLENCRQPPSLNMVLVLADFFNVPIDYLVGRTANRFHNGCYISNDKNIKANVSCDKKEETGSCGGRALNLDIFAQRLRALRLSRRLTLQNVGDAVGCNMKTIGNLEKTHNSPSLGVVIALADFFNVSVDYLVGWTDYADVSAPEEKTPKRKKLMEMVENLREENIDKALSYVTFLGCDKQCKGKNDA